MRQRTLFLFREFKNNAVFRIAYIVYFLLTVAVLAYALLNMLAGLSVDKFLYGVQIILLASLNADKRDKGDCTPSGIDFHIVVY